MKSDKPISKAGIVRLIKDEKVSVAELKVALVGVTKLELSSVGITDTDVEKLSEAIANNGTLKLLYLGHNQIGITGAITLSKVLEENSTLQLLDLIDNNIGDAGAEAIGKALEQNSTLQSLDLGYNHIGYSGGEAIGKALEQNSTLQSLNLKYNHIGYSGGEAIGKALEQNSTLQSLDLGYNNIGAAGVSAIDRGLEQNDIIQVLDFWEKWIGAIGAEAIGKALEQNSTLRLLDLGGNGIGDAGAEAIGKGLEQNSTLQKLDLNNNSINYTGAEAIGKALGQNSTLQKLDLGYNNIGYSGGEAIGKALEQNNTLQELYLQDNLIGAEQKIKINDLISRNNKKIEAFFNAITTGDIETVENCLKQGLNPNLLDKNSKNALHMVIANEQLVALFLSYGADPELKDREGQTALYIAKREGVKQSTIKMLENAVDKKILTWYGNASAQGTMNAQQALQEIKKMKNLKNITNLYADAKGNTIFHAVAIDGDEEMIRFFIYKGFDIREKNKDGDTPLGIVEKSNNKVLLEKMNLWLKEAKVIKKEQQFQQLVEEQSKQKAKETDFASERKALYKNVKELTETNPFIEAVQDLWTVKRQKQALLSTEAERFFTDLIFNHLNPPQILLRHAGYTPAEKLSLKLQNRTINPKHPIFSNLQKTIQKIDETIFTLYKECTEIAKIFDKLNRIRKLYEQYIEEICSAKDEDERKELYKIPSILRGAGMEPRQLSEEGLPLSVKTMHGQKINEYGTSAVKIINGVHFKENPHAPGVEFMVSSLSNALAGRGATPTELIKVINDKGQSINYLASKTIIGMELHDLLERHPDLIKKISRRNFSEMMVLGLLINPQDGKPDNYMVEIGKAENGEIKFLRIIGIDNDIAFADPVVLEHTGEKKGQHFVNVKNVIYLMPQMRRPVGPIFKKIFLQQSPEFVMIEWLKGLKEKNKEYKALLEEGVFTEKEFMGDGITSKLGLQLPIRLVPKTAATLYNKLKKIHHYLETQPNITHEELFMKIQPILARYYRGVIQEVKGDVMEGIKLLYKQNAPTIEEEVNLESQIRSDNTRVMTELVLRTAERYGFEEKRVQTIDASIREVIYAVDYSQYDKESTELLYQQYDGFGEIGLDYRNAKSFFVSAVQEKQCSETLLEHLFINCDLDITVRLERSDDMTLKGNETLLHFATQYNQFAAVESLIKRGVEVNAINVDGRTALHIAASTGNVEVIKCLIDSGAELNIKDELTSHTALDKALSKNKEEAAKLLLQKGAASGSNKYDGIIERLSKELTAKVEALKQGNSGKTLGKVNTDFVSKLNAAIETQTGLSP